jgi:predicted  nucleic acid-binding Zn-ribbon protein
MYGRDEMTKVKACKACGVSIEANAVSKTNESTKIPLKIIKCPICDEVLTDDDSENYY